MANHGYCKNCWWCKMIKGDAHTVIDSPMFGKISMRDIFEHGRCYMSNDSEGHPWHEVKSVSYCPDYINRKRAERSGYETLDEWIERQGLNLEDNK